MAHLPCHKFCGLQHFSLVIVCMLQLILPNDFISETMMIVLVIVDTEDMDQPRLTLPPLPDNHPPNPASYATQPMAHNQTTSNPLPPIQPNNQTQTILLQQNTSAGSSNKNEKYASKVSIGWNRFPSFIFN